MAKTEINGRTSVALDPALECAMRTAADLEHRTLSSWMRAAFHDRLAKQGIVPGRHAEKQEEAHV